MEEGKIGVRSVDQEDAVFLDRIPAGHGHVVGLAVGDHKGGGDGIPVVVVDMELNGALGLSKAGPVENTQTELYGGGVPGAQLVADADGIGSLQRSEPVDHGVKQLHVYLPCSLFVGVSEGGPMNLRDSQMIVAGPVGIETRFQVSEAVAPCDLCIQHGTELAPTGEPTNAGVSPEGAHLLVERRPRQKGCQLSKDCVTVCHGLPLLLWGGGFTLPHLTQLCTGAQAFFFLFASGNGKEQNPGNAKTCPPIQISKLRKNASFRFFLRSATLPVSLRDKISTYPHCLTGQQ